jgi:hypothetical protein
MVKLSELINDKQLNKIAEGIVEKLNKMGIPVTMDYKKIKDEKTEQTYTIFFMGQSRFEYQVTAKDEHTALEIAKRRHLHSEENDSIFISESITTDTANVFDENGKEVLNSSLV